MLRRIFAISPGERLHLFFNGVCNPFGKNTTPIVLPLTFGTFEHSGLLMPPQLSDRRCRSKALD